MKPRSWVDWAPTTVMACGLLLLTFVSTQQRPELQQPLARALPEEIAGMPGSDLAVSPEEAQVAGFTDYALRVYEKGDSAAATEGWVSVYLGFYDQQSRGRTIHSPQNCLPGAGWEALSAEPATIVAGSDVFTVNRYVLQNGDQRALVLYWYQGRGRVAHNEYAIKWDLLRDAALRRRTDEALVRIVVPFDEVGDGEGQARAYDIAQGVAQGIKPALDRTLPI